MSRTDMRKGPWKENDKERILSGRVGSVEEDNLDVNGKVKNTFYLQSQSNPEKKLMCICWQRIGGGLKSGDEVLMHGRFNEYGTFIAWSVLVNGNKNGNISDKTGV